MDRVLDRNVLVEEGEYRRVLENVPTRWEWLADPRIENDI